MLRWVQHLLSPPQRGPELGHLGETEMHPHPPAGAWAYALVGDERVDKGSGPAGGTVPMRGVGGGGKQL